jgi:hypothetical protein
MPLFKHYGVFIMYNTSKPQYMRKSLLSFFSKLLFVFILGISSQAKAQYVFSESFARPGVLSTTGWQVYTSNSHTFRDTVNGFKKPGAGSLHVSFFDMHSGDVDTLTLPSFPATVATDSVIFDHAHRAKSHGADSMAIWYSTNGGASYSYLSSYSGDATPSATTLSTVAPAIGPGKFRPALSSDWAHKGVQLPTGTNKLQFIFYSDGGDDLYLDNILVGQDPVNCTGTPFTGNLPATALICPGSALSISPDTLSYNPYITYQWQTSLDNGATDPWTNVSNLGGINSPDLFLASVSQQAWFRLESNCTNSGISSTTSAIHVLYDSTYNCYCRSNMGGWCNNWITNVSIAGTDFDNSSVCNDNDPVNKFTYYPPSLTTSDTITGGQPLVTINVSTDKFGFWINARLGIWIDFDKSGTFDSSEFTMMNNNIQTGTSSYTFTVPVTAVGGLTGMRVRTNDSFYPFDGTMACSTFQSGETEDYLIYINPAPVCNGIPNAGVPATHTPDICLGDKYTIRAEGVDFGAGVTYSWETSDDNGVTDPWATVSSPGATGVNTIELTDSGIVDTTYYRLKVVCNNTLDSTYSTSIAINVKPFFMCYCSANLGGNSCTPSTPYISNVTVNGSTINNTTGCSGNLISYSSFGLASSTMDTFDTEEMITLEVTNTEIPNRVAVWIDYDQDGTFEAAEYTEITPLSTANTASVKNIVIPATATTGYTGMRIRTVATADVMGANDACNNLASGETEDYVIYIQPSQACAGTPSAGVVNTWMSICAGNSLLIEPTGASYGPGLFYQWEESDDNGILDAWADVTTGSGFDSRSLHTAAIMDTIYYRLKVTCLASSFVYSDTIAVTLNNYYDCYCKDDLGAGNTCMFNEYISNVTIIGGNLNNSSTCISSGNNNNYTSNAPVGTATDTVTIGDFVDLQVTYAGSESMIGAWIDYDHSGSFDANEYILIAATTATGSTQTKTIEIPATALPGLTGLRIRTNCSSCLMTASEACTNYLMGETEDYFIMIEQAPVCSGTPVAGTIPSSNLICANMPFSIQSAGSVYNTGLTYQWEESDDNGVADAWTDVSGQDTRSLNLSTGIAADIYFRMKTVCTTTMDSVYTNTMFITVDSFYNCYDAGTNLGGGNCFGNDKITHLWITNEQLDNTSLCNTTSFGTRSSFPAAGSTTMTMIAKNTYELNVYSRQRSSIGVWIDYNRNGIFDNTEFTFITGQSFGAPVAKNIAIPASAKPGPTGMRVRTNQVLMFGGTMTPTNAATTFFSGETEDYIITLDTVRPVSNVTLSNIGTSEITVSWTNGNGNARLVIAKEASTPLTDPADGTTSYAADPAFASGNGDSTATGNYIVYNGGHDTSVTITGLNMLTNYEFYVYEYLGTTTGDNVYALPGQMAAGATLPVSMLSFNAVKKQDDVVLNWSTASEINNEGFTVQRSKGKGQWEDLGFVKGHGTTNTVSRYAYIDHIGVMLNGAEAYYRLRQKDFDGKTSYSQVVSVSAENAPKASIALHPNPFVESITLTIQSKERSTLHITVRDVFGKTVAEKTMAADKGNTTLTLDQLAHLANGIYFLQVEQQGEVQNFKVTKAR